MEIIYKSPSELKPFQKNPYNHPEKQLTMLKKSMREFGFTSPVLISQDNMVIAGHARLKAAQEIGLSEVPTIFIDLPYEKAVAYVIADNQLAKLAEEDRDLLGELLQGINDIPDFDIEAMGFSSEDLDSILGSEPGEVVEDEFNPDDVGESRCKEGDLWALGSHRLLCGDSTIQENVERLMGGVKADMVFTDPPYGYSYESNYQTKHEMLINDDKILDFIPNAIKSTKENAPFYVFTGWQTVDEWIKLVRGYSLDLKNIIVWKKNNWSMGDLKGAYAGQYEMILFLHKGRVELIGERCRDVWEFDREPPKEHPTMKPIELISFALSKSSTPSSVILDMFLGSGSTLIACEQLNRTCYGMELDPHYCDVIISRWEQFTGQTAKKLT